jgi:hypothetical protein
MKDFLFWFSFMIFFYLVYLVIVKALCKQEITIKYITITFPVYFFASIFWKFTIFK